MERGTKLLLLPDPDNAHDPSAVKVVSLGGMMLGFVPKDISAKVAKLLKSRDYYVTAFKDGATFNSFTIEWTGGDPLA